MILMMLAGCGLTELFAPPPEPPAPAPVQAEPEPAPAEPVEAAPVEAEPAAAPDPDLGRTVWEGLGHTKNQCDHYDYFPDGGMRIFACHVATHLDYEALVVAYSGFVFVRGPHTPAKLDLENPGDFGRYNPEFVRWLGETFIPGATDAAFRERTQPLYDANVRPLARTMEVVYRKLTDPQNAGCASQERRWYELAVNDAHNFDSPDATSNYVERWYGFLATEFCDRATRPDVLLEFGAIPTEYDGNVVKTTVGFWIRRTIDGTAEVWHEQLDKLLRAYDADWLRSLGEPD